MIKDKYTKYGATVALLVAIGLGVYVISPYLLSVCFAAILAVLINPIYELLNKYIKNSTVSALITSVFTVTVFLLPLLAVLNTIIYEIGKLYSVIIKQISANGDQATLTEIIQPIVDTAAGLGINLQATLNQVFSVIIDFTQGFIFSLPSSITKIFIIIFVTFFLLKDKKIILEQVQALIPLEKKYRAEFIDKVNMVTRGVLYGTLVTAFIQGIIAGVGYWVFGVSAPFVLAIVTMFFALIPFLGTQIVWVPTGIILILSNLEGSWWTGVGLLIYGALVISTSDNIIKPKLIGDSAQLHPAYALLGIFGGLQVFGTVGIILGPIALAVIIQYIAAYRKQYNI